MAHAGALTRNAAPSPFAPRKAERQGPEATGVGYEEEIRADVKKGQRLKPRVTRIEGDWFLFERSAKVAKTENQYQGGSPAHVAKFLKQDLNDSFDFLTDRDRHVERKTTNSPRFVKNAHRCIRKPNRHYIASFETLFELI